MSHPTLIAMMGMPASGKSTFIEEERLRQFAEGTEVVVVSPDEIRLAITGDMSNQDRNEEVFQTAHAMAKLALNQGTSVIWDATNVTERARYDLLKTAAACAADTRLVVVDVPLLVCIQRNASRERVVPEGVMFRMHQQFCESLSRIGWEGWRVIERTPYLG